MAFARQWVEPGHRHGAEDRQRAGHLADKVLDAVIATLA